MSTPSHIVAWAMKLQAMVAAEMALPGVLGLVTFGSMEIYGNAMKSQNVSSETMHQRKTIPPAS